MERDPKTKLTKQHFVSIQGFGSAGWGDRVVHWFLGCSVQECRTSGGFFSNGQWTTKSSDAWVIAIVSDQVLTLDRAFQLQYLV